MTIIPRGEDGLILGPGYANLFKLVGSGITKAEVKDQGDGIYVATVFVADRKKTVDLDISVKGEVIHSVHITDRTTSNLWPWTISIILFILLLVVLFRYYRRSQP